MEISSGEPASTSLLPLDTLGGTIKAHIAAGDKAVDKAEEHYKAAGIHLGEAKDRVARTKGLTWSAFLIKNCSIGTRRADELISIAEGRTSLVELRAANAASKQRSRVAAKSAGRPAQSSEIVEEEQEPTHLTEESFTQELRNDPECFTHMRMFFIARSVEALDS